MVGPHEIITPEGVPKLVCASWCGKRRGKVRNETDANVSVAKLMGKEMTESILTHEKTEESARNEKQARRVEKPFDKDKKPPRIGRDDPRWPFDPNYGLVGGF